MRLASFNINFDTLNEAYGFPTDFTDRCFFEVFDRFVSIANQYSFKYTIFVIGRDLESGRHREAVAEWARQGHEIGNHSWSHHMNLGALSVPEIYSEVQRSHEAIANVIGREPKGFITPAWSNSYRLSETLLKCGYEYDTSTFPSWMLSPMAVRIALGYRGTEKAKRILHRRDYIRSLYASRRPTLFTSQNPQLQGRSLCVLPLPANRLRFPCWHTTGYMFGWDFHRRLLESCLRDVEYFYYLMHPGDLIAVEDQDPRYAHSLARMSVPLEVKMQRLSEMVAMIANSGRRLVTLSEMQKHARASLFASCETSAFVESSILSAARPEIPAQATVSQKSTNALERVKAPASL